VDGGSGGRTRGAVARTGGAEILSTIFFVRSGVVFHTDTAPAVGLVGLKPPTPSIFEEKGVGRGKSALLNLFLDPPLFERLVILPFYRS